MRFDRRAPGFRRRVSSRLLAFLALLGFSGIWLWLGATSATSARPGTQAPTSPTPANRYLPLILRQEALPTGSPAERALARANYYRQLGGIPPLRLDAAIARAAASHAGYYVLNAGTPGAFPGGNAHGEVPGYPGFTGEGFWDRMEAAGYGGNAVFEVMHFINGPEATVEDWIATVYHRIPFMNPRVTDAGYGEGQGRDKAAVMDFGTTPGVNPVSDDVVSVYPANGQSEVPRAWGCGEAPNPYADIGCSGSNPVGFVITILAMGSQQFDGLTLRTIDGAPVAIHALRYDQGFRVWYAAARRPLAANTSYTVTLTGTNDNGSPLSMQWTFTTGSKLYHNSDTGSAALSMPQQPESEAGPLEAPK